MDLNVLGLDKIPVSLQGDTQEAINHLAKVYLTQHFSVVTNPSDVATPFNIYPLAAPITKCDDLKVVVMDMDGTTTSTENICIFSQQYMMQTVTTAGKVFKLNPELDYPHIIGNSTTKHVEYLFSKYQAQIVDQNIVEAFKAAAAWTLANSPDATRKKEVSNNAKLLDAGSLDNSLRIKLAIDIYYAKYHQLLADVAEKQKSGDTIAGEELITPMPGVAILLPLLKGYLADLPHYNFIPEGIDSEKFAALAKHFAKYPARLGLVTSSIFYEANIVLQEVFSAIKSQIKTWGLSEDTKLNLQAKFSNYNDFYDTVVTASDSNEIRLKPHPDLYNIALRNMGVAPADYAKVLGLEDSESGLLAMRAAGISRSFAVPFKETSGHNFAPAAKILEAAVIDLLKILPEEYNF